MRKVSTRASSLVGHNVPANHAYWAQEQLALSKNNRHELLHSCELSRTACPSKPRCLVPCSSPSWCDCLLSLVVMDHNTITLPMFMQCQQRTLLLDTAYRVHCRHCLGIDWWDPKHRMGLHWRRSCRDHAYSNTGTHQELHLPGATYTL